MVIKLRGVDFSSNNIGNIPLVEREVRDDVKTLLNNYGRTFSKREGLAVQDFIDGLKSENLWTNIGNLYIPALAEDVSKTLLNIKTGVFDATPKNTVYLLQDKGLRTIYDSSNGVIPADDRAVVKTNGSYMNMHMMVYITPQDKTLENEYDPIDYFSLLGNGVTKTFRTALNRTNGQWNVIWNSASPKYLMGMVKDTLSNFIGISCGSDGVIIGVNDNSDRGNLGPTETVDTTMTDVPTYIGLAYNYTPSCTNPMRMISMGTSFTKEQLLKYNELCDALIAAIC